MAQVGPNGDLMLEQEDVLPRKVAIKTDDPQHIIDAINKINPTIKTAEDLAAAVAQIDELRKKHHGVTNPDLEKVNQESK